MISITVPTYQHAPYIGRCLDGLLMQKTEFPVEILVGEDESKDGTREICQRYAAEHPDRIELLLGSRKDVISILGRPTGRANLLRLLRQAKGKYIAVCEGDDYWIDPSKLQRQVDLLESDPEASGCFTQAYNEAGSERTPYVDEPIPGPWVDQRQMVQGQPVPTCTLVFRREYLEGLWETLDTSPVGDTVILVHMAGQGHLRFLPEFTAVRSIHPGGIHSMTARAEQAFVHIHTLEHIEQVSTGRFTAIVEKRRQNALLVCWEHSVGVDHRRARWAFWRILPKAGEMGWGVTTTMRNLLCCYLPWIPGVVPKRERIP